LSLNCWGIASDNDQIRGEASSASPQISKYKNNHNNQIKQINNSQKWVLIEEGVLWLACWFWGCTRFCCNERCWTDIFASRYGMNRGYVFGKNKDVCNIEGYCKLKEG